MNIILYESSSFGGCYEYIKYLFRAYKEVIPSTILILPSQSEFSGKDVRKILLSDSKKNQSKIIKRIYFLYRQFINPLILLCYLLTKPASLVILNDFEQISAPFWAPLYRLFLKKHNFAVVLHDPDRDAYPPSKEISRFCMKAMMRAMDLGLYHEYLPEKPYYKNVKTFFLKVPHGIFHKNESNQDLQEWIKKMKGNCQLMSIVGNIRKEKNYTIAIEALKELKNWKLLIAGAPANSSVSVFELKKKAEECGVEGQIIWVEKFLSDTEMASVIEVTDLILLNYSRTFTSQSGILNLIAPYNKKVIISDAESSLSKLAKRFNFGTLIEPDNTRALIEGVLGTENQPRSDWESYCKYASWNNHVNEVLKAVKL